MSCKQFATVYSGDTVKSKSDVIDNIIKQLEKLQEEIKKNEKSI
jgi:hypothetical protein